MRVLHISTPSTWRGGEQQVFWLLSEQRRQGLKVGLMTPTGSVLGEKAKEAEPLLFSFRRRGAFDPVAAWHLRRICRGEQFDIIHAHDSHAHTLAVLSASLFGNPLPVFVSRRVDFPASSGGLGKSKYHHPKVKGFICVSKAIKSVMLKSGIDAAKLHVVRSGIDIKRFEGRGDGRLRREFGIPPDVPIVANLSAIAPHKDYPTFVKAAEYFLATNGRARFLIIGGDGGEEETMRGLVQEKGLQNDLIFTGFRNDVPDILPEVDLFLITSKTEGLGTTILDAFAAGVPVVATKAGGIPEIVRHRETGLLADLGDSQVLATYLHEMLNDAALRGGIIERSKQWVRMFSKEKVAEETLKIYRGEFIELGEESL
ncbi:MAG: glycosyltransferase family 4 protein [Ignavibacteriae bacterium]|nr:glycosyltransferase family 4 protein [Ignavibacteriota bacterium]